MNRLHKNIIHASLYTKLTNFCTKVTCYSDYFWLTRNWNAKFVFICISYNFCKFLTRHLRHTQICKNKCIIIPKLLNGFYCLNSIITIQISVHLVMNIDLNSLKNGFHGRQAELFIVKHQNSIIFIFSEHLLFLANC